MFKKFKIFISNILTLSTLINLLFAFYYMLFKSDFFMSNYFLSGAILCLIIELWYHTLVNKDFSLKSYTPKEAVPKENKPVLLKIKTNEQDEWAIGFYTKEGWVLNKNDYYNYTIKEWWRLSEITDISHLGLRNE